MSSYNRRYAILQDPKLKDSELETVQSVTDAPTVAGVDQSTKEDMYGEGYLHPHVESTESNGDVSITASGSVLETFEADVQNPSTYAFEAGESPRKTGGSGLIQTDGSGNRSRFSFIKDGQSDYQIRTTPNYFGKVPFTLNSEQLFIGGGTAPKAQCFTRPEILSLKNGNLLCAYLNSYSPPWMWSFESGLLDPSTQQLEGNVSLTGYNAVTNVCSVSLATWGAHVQVNSYFTQTAADADPQYAKILEVDSVNRTFTIEDNGMSVSVGAGQIYDVGRFENRPAYATDGNVKLRLSVSKDQFWSEENTSYPLYPDIAPTFTDWMEFGATGLSLVQFPDTEEVLLISCGYIGNSSDFINNASYLNVDEIKSSLDSYSGLKSGIDDFSLIERRSSLSLNKDSGFFGNDASTDIANLNTMTQPLDMTAEVLPSGRLVVVVAMSDKLVSLVSDDRGVTFSATEIFDLTFGSNYEYQQFCSVDSVISPSGEMVLLLTANSLGDRGAPSTTPSANDTLGESVVSIFVSASGDIWSSEKRLGGGSYNLGYVSVSYAGLYPTNIASHIDESIYALSGSICMTPEYNFLVSLCTLNIGGIGNHQGCHVYQRVLSTNEIKFGDTGLDIAPSLPAQIYSSAQPVEAAISRSSMALPYFGGARDNAYSTMPALEDYFDYTFSAVNGIDPTYSPTTPRDRGYLGALYFAGVRNASVEPSVYKRFGGGPILGQGPIDIATCLHNGEIVTAVCEMWENEPSDSPKSTEYLKSRSIYKSSIQRNIHVLFSGGLQPLRVNLPNELRRFEAAYDVAGRIMKRRYDDAPTDKVGVAVFVYRAPGSNDQTYVNVTSAAPPGPYYVDFSNSAELTAADISGNDRQLQFRIIENNGWNNGPRFIITGRSSQSNPPRTRLELTPVDAADDVLDNVYGGFQASVLPSPDVELGDIESVGNVFGSNCYQLSLLGAKNPQYWGWQRASSGVNGSIVEDVDGGVSYATKWQIAVAANNYLNYSFDKDYSQSEAYGKFTFPNRDGEVLKSSYPAERDALSFVQRLVVQIQRGGNRRAGVPVQTTGSIDFGLRCSARVFLRDSERASGNFLSLGLGISRVDDNVYLRLIKEYWNSTLSNTSYIPIGDELSFSDEGDAIDSHEKVPYYEIIWGVKPQGALDTYTAFLYARPWNRYSDPQFMNDFTKMAPVNVLSTDLDFDGNDLASSTAAEFVSFGTFDTTSDPITRVSFPAVQFSRSFLQKSPAFAEEYSEGELPSGLFDFREILHVAKEPALDFLRLYNAGQMSPMSPPICKSIPQVVDNGIELAFRGRATGSQTFTYSGKSQFPAESIFFSPVKEGWRSPGDTLIFSVPSENPAVSIESPRLPAYEMIFDAGGPWINPESISFFGINTGSIVVDFNVDSANFATYGNVQQADFTMVFAAPGHPTSLLFNYWANSVQESNSPIPPINAGDPYLIGPAPTGSFTGGAGALVTLNVPAGFNVLQNPWAPNIGDTKRTIGGGLDIWNGSTWAEYYANIPRMFYKPLYLMHFQGYGLRSGDEVTLSDSDIRWNFDPDSPRTVMFSTDSSTGSAQYAPFRPGQFKSQTNENFYLLVVDRQAGGQDLQPTALRQTADAKYCYYYKILDNGSDYLTIDRDITDTFRWDENNASNDGKLTPGSMTILSDRAAANSPDFFDHLGSTTLERGARYRYMRITVTGGEHSDPNLKLGMSICGQRLDLSNPDFSLEYSYDLESGSSLFDSISGRRKSRRNHKPRKSFGVSYEPRPSAETYTQTIAEGTDVTNTRRGYGNIDSHVAQPAQAQTMQKLSWQELVERILSIGIDGGVLALGFDGNNMQTLSGTVLNTTPLQYDDAANLKPALSDPHGLCAARLTGYQGASNVAYQHQSVIANSQGGLNSSAVAPSQSLDPTECIPAAVMSIKGLKFTEEL
tara:strand:- start:16130 stop:21874 length:5745 start_codon:yes stop_codon:yes gene_type:complete